MKVDPFDLKAALQARHAQHVVLVHFPIALFLTGVAFDAAAQWRRSASLAVAARYNLWIAAIASVPVVASGIAAWQLQLEGQRLKGTLLLHLVFGATSAVAIWLTLWMHARARRQPENALPRYRLIFEFVAAAIVGFTAHLGGFLSGVNRAD
jgi:uncharacterized membrane protein